MAYDQTIIDQVLVATDIVEVIGKAITLKKSGANYKAHCPFHREKTPSFMVSPVKQIFHCFGCGIGGNAFTFLMKYENMTFFEALELLAHQGGVTLPEKRAFSQEKKTKIRQVLDIFRAADDYYRSVLVDPKLGKRARAYLQKRGITEGMCEQFHVGYAADTWHGLFDYLEKKDFPRELIMKTGLVLPSERGTSYDFFRGRVIFPIMNTKSTVIGFGGRTLGNEEPKYINTPETEYFRKRFELYGLHDARKPIQDAGSTVLIVEGYLDVIRLHQVDIKNVVAPLGTALTQDHVRILRRYAEKAVMVFDGDAAGTQAALRSIDHFLVEGLCVEVIGLPEGYDPDSFVRERGREAFLSFVNEGQDVFDFKYEYVARMYDKNESLGLIKITDEMLMLIRNVTNGVLRDRYLKKLAQKVQVHETTLRDELDKKMKTGPDLHEETEETEEKQMRTHMEEVYLIKLLLDEPSWIGPVSEILESDNFARKDTREIFLELMRMYENGVVHCDLNVLTSHVHTESAKVTLSELPFLTIQEDNYREAFEARIGEIKISALTRKLHDIHLRLTEAEAQGNYALLEQYQYEKIQLQNEKNTIKQKGLAVNR